MKYEDAWFAHFEDYRHANVIFRVIISSFGGRGNLQLQVRILQSCPCFPMSPESMFQLSIFS